MLLSLKVLPLFVGMTIAFPHYTSLDARQASPTATPTGTVCVGGTGPGNYAGLCSFDCNNGYCPSPCTCTSSGTPVPTPPTTGVHGYPLPSEDNSYSGLCSFACNHGYCPSTACSTTPPPPVCVGGTGPGNYAGLCSFDCNYGYCPSPCTCTSSGIPVPTPPTTGITGVPLPSEDNSYSGLCSFACNHGYCPDTACNTAANAAYPYQAPGPSDSRSPCPALNTLANHGYLNHDGRNISHDDIITAFLDGFGIANSTIAVALDNAFIVCEYVTGQPCNTLVNLTLLAEPHAFEHDHSFSRQDYRMAYLSNGDEFTDNQNFNLSIFEASLSPVGGLTHVNFTNANQIRLQRESNALVNDYPGWFVQDIPVQEFEFGFIYAVMSDPTLAGFSTGEPLIRLDWWKYWFINESFPFPLGWAKPVPPKEASFVASVSSQILAAPISSTPSPLPTNALSPFAPPEATLPSADTTTLYPLPTYTPYVAPLSSALQRRAMPSNVLTRLPSAALNAYSAVKSKHPAPTFKNPFFEPLVVSDIAAKQAWARTHMSQVQEALAMHTPPPPAA